MNLKVVGSLVDISFFKLQHIKKTIDSKEKRYYGGFSPRNSPFKILNTQVQFYSPNTEQTTIYPTKAF